MGADYPDWGGQYNSQAFYPLFDMGELAARLGALVTYDRRGNLVWQYSFEHGLDTLNRQTNSASSTVTLSKSTVDTPPFSARLFAIGASGGLARIYRQSPVPPGNKIGLSVAARIATGHYFSQLLFTHYNGTTKYSAQMDIKSSTDKLTIVDVSGTVDVITGLPDLSTGLGFMFMKLVVDLTTHKYERLIFLNQEYDLSAYTMLSEASTTTPSIEMSIAAKTVDDTNDCTIFIDDIAITANEPGNS